MDFIKTDFVWWVCQIRSNDKIFSGKFFELCQGGDFLFYLFVFVILLLIERLASKLCQIRKQL